MTITSTAFERTERLVLLVLALMAGIGLPVRADDWPTYLQNNARDGITSATVAFPLHAQWVYRAPAVPQPLWPEPQEGYNEYPRMRFDDAFYTVSVGGIVYFGSSVDHHVYALDAATGAVRWSYCTEGPVRLAPTVARGSVFVGSDDGVVYCLDAADGRLIWKVRGRPDARRVLARGRMISLWPIHTSVLVDDGIAYFGAGIFPHHGVSLTAVQADSGDVIWRNTTPGQGERGKAAAGFTPQGYLLASERYLFAPSGRAVPSCFDRDSGAPVHVVGQLLAPHMQVPKMPHVVGQPGKAPKGAASGVDGMLTEGLIFTGTQNFLLGFAQDTGVFQFVWSEARRLIVTPTHYYLLRGLDPSVALRARLKQTTTEVVAIDRAVLRQHDAAQNVEEMQRRQYGKETRWRFDQWDPGMKESARWRLARANLDTIILAGGTVFAGGANEVVAIDAVTGKEVWTGAVEGRAVGLTVAGGHLFVSTDRGTIHGFGADALPVREERQAAEPFAPDGRTAQAAQAIVADTGINKGYALVIGEDSARLAHELAKRTSLQVYCVEPDLAKAQRARVALTSAGEYGTRIVVESMGDGALPHPDYFANLIVLTDPAARVAAAELLRVLRPYGGVLLAGQLSEKGSVAWPDETPAGWQAAGRVRTGYALPGAGKWLKYERGPLEGAGSWTHQHADAGNTAASNDQRLKAPLDVLWFGDPGPAEAPERHLRSVAPLSINGRVYYQGFRFADKRNYVACFDAFNGTKYWEREIAGAYRVGLFNASQIGDCGNMACTPEHFFVAAGPKCYRLDAVTGEITATYTAPTNAEGKVGDWQYIAIDGPILVGSLAKERLFSDTVFAFDVRTGEQRWIYRGGTIRNNTLTVCDGRVLFAELPVGAKTETDVERAKRLGVPIEDIPIEPYSRTIVALEVQTGQPAWRTEVDLTDCGPWSSQLLSLARDGVIVFCGAYNRHDPPTGKEPLRRALAMSIRDGSVLWNRPVGNFTRPLIIGGLLLADPWGYDLRTGEQHMEPHPKTGQPVPRRFGLRGTGGCGQIAASEKMLFYRAGSTMWYDLDARAATLFQGPRPGCWINMVPANGLLIQLEASSGCQCNHSLQSTLVYKPRETP